MTRVIIILFGVLLTNSASAEIKNKLSTNNPSVVGISVGPTWASGNQTQTLYLESDVKKTYTAENNGTAFPTIALFMGLQKTLTVQQMRQPLLSQFGISLVQAGDAKLSGDIWEDADPQLNNFNYHYKVNHTHVALSGRLIAFPSDSLQPYISGSIGMGLNRAYGFTITPKISEEVAAPTFASNTTTSFIYTLGIGLQKSLTSRLQVAIGYEFSNWGKIQLSRAAGQTVNQQLSLNHLYAQQLQLSLYYLF